MNIGNEVKKVLFFPYYLYLQYEPFRQVIANLNSLGIKAYMVLIDSNSPDEKQFFSSENIPKNGCQIKILRVHKFPFKNNYSILKFFRFLFFLLNRPKIHNFLLAEHPDLVVVGSDLGGLYIRHLLDLCHRLQIPVLIFITIDFGYASGNASLLKEKYPFLARTLFRIIGIERLVFFHKWVIGSYSPKTKILVPSKFFQNQLIKNGIDENRLILTGIPKHDQIFEILREPRSSLKNEIVKIFNIDFNSRIIVYCTEVIHFVYGLEYLNNANELLAKAFKSLPSECQIIIKLHPREDKISINYFSKIFSGQKYHIIRNINNQKMLRVADIVIGHYSATLLDAILLETPVLSINLLHDQKRMLFNSDFSSFYINSKTEFSKIYDLLYDQTTQKINKVYIQKWIQENAPIIDGRSLERISSNILRILNNRHV